MLNNEINDKKAQEMKKENYKKYVKQKTPVHALGTNMLPRIPDRRNRLYDRGVFTELV